MFLRKLLINFNIVLLAVMAANSCCAMDQDIIGLGCASKFVGKGKDKPAEKPVSKPAAKPAAPKIIGSALPAWQKRVLKASDKSKAAETPFAKLLAAAKPKVDASKSAASASSSSSSSSANSSLLKKKASGSDSWLTSIGSTVSEADNVQKTVGAVAIAALMYSAATKLIFTKVQNDKETKPWHNPLERLASTLNTEQWNQNNSSTILVEALHNPKVLNEEKSKKFRDSLKDDQMKLVTAIVAKGDK